MADQKELATLGAFLSQNASTTLLDGVSMRSSGEKTVIYLFFLSICKFDSGSVITNIPISKIRQWRFNRNGQQNLDCDRIRISGALVGNATN